MMMAFDSGHTSPSPLDDETVSLVRDALRAYLDDTRDAGPLRAALIVMAAEARAKAILPEQLLVLLKDLWGSLAEVRRMNDVGEQVRMQQRVVTMCIREYYST